MERSRALVTILGFGYAFLYIPIIILIIYSFNESKLVTVWSGFSTIWYQELIHDEQLLAAAWVSLRIAFFGASASVVLGTACGLILTRMPYFRGKTFFSALISVPLVMPEVITGLSLLLLFVDSQAILGFPQGRGMLTLWIAHVTFTTAYVAIIIASRLGELDSSLENAAMDLGATPIKVFFVITLPIIAPALVSGWLLGFTLSIDDLVISSFVAGPDSSTLPMVIYSSVRLGVNPKINALASIMIAIVTFIGVLSTLIMLRGEKRRKKEMEQALLNADVG
jgi:putrescine transport system permease protein